MRPALHELGARVACEQDRSLAAQDLPSSDALLEGIARKRTHAQRRVHVTAAAASALVVLLLLFATALLRGRAATAAVGTTHAADRSVPLRFDDGTTLVLARGATAVVDEVRPHGASVTLRTGSLTADVVHTAETRWDVHAGPFGIHVTGTKFDAAWDPEKKELTVAMSEGTVVVSGPCVADERLSAPARKTFSCEATAAPSSAPPPAAPSSMPSGGPELDGKVQDARVEEPAAPAASAVPVPAAVVAPRWKTLATRGDFVGANAAMSTRDVDAALAHEPAATLVALADAARLSRDDARARALYMRVRERFPTAPEAQKAAFLLGRMAWAAGSAEEAVRWFEAVAHEPSGTFAQEALGRLVEVEHGRGARARAKTLAGEYLARYPNGAHAAYARSVAEAEQ